jgi:hypothetical protein
MVGEQPWQAVTRGKLEQASKMKMRMLARTGLPLIIAMNTSPLNTGHGQPRNVNC